MKIPTPVNQFYIRTIPKAPISDIATPKISIPSSVPQIPPSHGPSIDLNTNGSPTSKGSIPWGPILVVGLTVIFAVGVAVYLKEKREKDIDTLS